MPCLPSLKLGIASINFSILSQHVGLHVRKLEAKKNRMPAKRLCVVLVSRLQFLIKFPNMID